MKILYVLSSTIPHGGATKSFLILMRQVRAHGHQVAVVLPDADGIKPLLDQEGVPTYIAPLRFDTYPPQASLRDYVLWLPRLAYRQWLNARAVRRLRRMVSAFSPDIIHTNVSVVDTGRRLAARLHVPHIHHFREYADLDFGLRYFPSKAYMRRHVQYAISITRGVAEHHGLSGRETSRTIYNGIMPRQESCPARGKADYWLYAGRLEPTKGIEELLQAYAHSASSIPLRVAGAAGQEAYARYLRGLAISLGVADRVEFLGARDDVLSLMQQAKALVVPSRFEAFGRCMAEAMFVGCPVIGKNTGGTREQMDNGLQHTGHEIALRYETEEQLAHVLAHYDTLYNEKMRLGAFDTVNALYTNEENARRILSFYDDILKAK